MKIPVHDCLHYSGNALPLEKTYERPNVPDWHEHLLHISPVHFQGEGRLQNGVFIVKGTITGEYTLMCSKCLSEMGVPFSRELEEHFNIDAINSKRDAVELEEVHDVDGNIIDLLPYIVEEILVSIPFAPACESVQQCRQNLPYEGKNWRLVTETEQVDKVDPRLADLAKFFDESDQ